MRQIFKAFAFFAAATFALSSCQKEAINSTKPSDGCELLVNIIGEKTILDGGTVKWEANDQIGVYTTSEKNLTGKIAADNAAQFSVTLKTALTSGDKIYCYSPYKYQSPTPASTSASLEIPQEQTGDFDAMPKVGIPYTLSADMSASAQNIADIKFCNLASVMAFKIYSSSYSSEKVASISFTANSPIAGKFNFDLTAVDISNPATLAITGLSSSTVTVETMKDIPTTADTADEIDMIIAPGSYTGTLVITTNEATYTFNIDTAKDFSRSGKNIFKVNLGNGERVALPEVTGLYEYTFTAQRYTQNTYKALGALSWGAMETGTGMYFGYDGTKGQQFGSGSQKVEKTTLSANKYADPVSIIKINASMATSANAKIAVSVNGISYKCNDNESASLTNSAADYAFVPDGTAQSGEIVISLTQTTTKAIYVKSISINKFEAATVSLGEIEATSNSATVSVEFDPKESSISKYGIAWRASGSGEYTTYEAAEAFTSYTITELNASTTYDCYAYVILSDSSKIYSAGAPATPATFTTLAAGGKVASLELSSSKKFGTSSGSTQTDDKENTWTITSGEGAGAIQNAYQTGYHGQQLGTGTTAWTGTISAPISGNISKVRIDANTGGNATIAVTVGTTSFTCGGNTSVSVVKNSSANAATWYEFTGTATGNVVITVSGTSKAFYFGGVEVTYTSTE